MKLKLFFHYTLTVALLCLVGTAAFAQEPVTTVFDNGGKSIKGDFHVIGNRSDAGYDLNIPTIDGCPSTVKWARLYWAGHAGTGNKDQVRLSGPGGLNRTVQSSNGHNESKAVQWDDADYLIYRVQFNDGSDLDIRVTVSQPSGLGTGGWCAGNFYNQNFAQWSGDNRGTGREAVLFKVGNMRAAGHTKLRFNYSTWWYGHKSSGKVSILVEGYKGGTMVKNGYDWYNSGGTLVGTYNFPTVTINEEEHSCTSSPGNVGDFEYNFSDGRLIWYQPNKPPYVAGQNDDLDPTKTIVNDGTRVTDDSYYYRWADVTADLQALATAGNLNGTYKVDNIYNEGGASWKFTSGWALVVVFENPKLGENRVISIRQGFQRVGAGAATTSADNNVFTSGYLKPSGTWEVFGQVALGGEPNVAGDHFKVNTTDVGYNGRANNNFFNGTTTINNDAPQVNNRGWDVSFFGNSTYIPAGATNLNTVYEANNGGYDAYIRIVNAVSAATAQPVYELETKVLNTANADIEGQRIPLNTEAKYQINMRNRGHDLPTALKLEALLPKNLSYVGIEGALPSGVSAPTSTNVGGQTLLTFAMTPNALPTGTLAFSTITIKVKTTNDCDALRDACSNKLSIQPKLVYTVANPTENREQLSHKKLADCAPAATTFYIEDAPCGQSSRNTLPYCAAFELDGGAGYTSYKWTKQGQGVVSTSQRYQVNAAGTYVLERTGGPADCANVSTKTYVIQPRSGNDALHPLRDNDKVVEKQTCNNTGLDYLQVALCGSDSHRYRLA